MKQLIFSSFELNKNNKVVVGCLIEKINHEKEVKYFISTFHIPTKTFHNNEYFFTLKEALNHYKQELKDQKYQEKA